MKNRKLKDIIGDIVRKIIPDVQEYEYLPISASRTVVKFVGSRMIREGGFYNTDIWNCTSTKLKGVVFNGYTLYYEIVGWAGQKMIQKDYDYLCPQGENRILIYRVTETSKDGQVYEYSWNEIKDFCREHGLEHVKELFTGTIKDWMQKYSDDGETFLDALKGVYLEKDCQYCSKKVPAEGICIRNESGNKIAYKLKSKAFLLKETAELDKGTEILS